MATAILELPQQGVEVHFVAPLHKFFEAKSYLLQTIQPNSICRGARTIVDIMEHTAHIVRFEAMEETLRLMDGFLLRKAISAASLAQKRKQLLVGEVICLFAQEFVEEQLEAALRHECRELGGCWALAIGCLREWLGHLMRLLENKRHGIGTEKGRSIGRKEKTLLRESRIAERKATAAMLHERCINAYAPLPCVGMEALDIVRNLR